MSMKTSHATVAVLALLLAACEAKDHGAVEVFGICVVEDAEECSTSGKCELVLVGRPHVFTSADRLGGGTSANALHLWVEVDNNLPPNDNPDLYRVNTNDFTIEEYLLEFHAPGISIPSKVEPAGSLTIRAESSQTPLIPVIPADRLAVIAAALPNTVPPAAPSQRIVGVDVTVRGRLQDGTDYETAPFRIDVDVIDAVGGLPGCAKATEVVVAVCPNEGQTATYACATP
jgi:hypothetical protein